MATFLILGLERYGFRPLEAVISVLVGIIAANYVVETVLDRPEWGQVLFHAVVPRVSMRSRRPLLLVPVREAPIEQVPAT